LFKDIHTLDLYTLVSIFLLSNICLQFFFSILLQLHFNNGTVLRFVTMIPCVFTGLSIKRDDCTVCNELYWSTGELASDYQGFWGDSQPNDEDGDCVYLTRNQQDYVYDRPYVFYYGNCYRKLSFICERMAAPAGKTLIDATRCFELIKCKNPW